MGPKVEVTGNENSLIYNLTGKELDITEEDLQAIGNEIQDLHSEPDEDWQPRQPSSDSRIWRYFNFTQLMSIIERDSLWFSDLTEFDDPYEGTVPKENIYEEIDILVDSLDYDREEIEPIYELFNPKKAYNKERLVNCWNKNQYESAALWEQYLDSPEGVAISTTVENVKSALEDSGYEMVYGEVKYINYETDRIPMGVLPTVYHKRKSFQHENEFRISFAPDESDSIDSGEYISVNVDDLIDKVYISPTAAGWFYDQVKQVLDTYDVDCEIVKSNVYSGPVY